MLHERKVDGNGSVIYYGILIDLLDTLAQYLNFE